MATRGNPSLLKDFFFFRIYCRFEKNFDFKKKNNNNNIFFTLVDSMEMHLTN